MITRERVLAIMENAFRRMERGIAPPEWVPWRKSLVLRYKIQSIEQALIQKLARVISGLRAADALLAAGFVQEQGIIHRVLDETNEDIMFLALARTNDVETPLHQRYLKAFYEDQLAEVWNSKLEIKGPDMPSRKAIRAYIRRVAGHNVEPTNAVETVARAYGGYVHGASQNLMDMCGAEERQFHVSGMLGTPRIAAREQGGWDYLYRGFSSLIVAAKAFGDKSLLDALMPELDRLNAQMEGRPRAARRV